MTNTSHARLGAADLPFALEGRLFHTEAAVPCRVLDSELWFSPFRDRERAAKHCMGCPFLGRCGYNAVVSRATHGVWGGQVLPGDFPGLLDPIYQRLLAQFEARRDVELGDLPAPALPGAERRRRRRAAA
jgi:WhiB family transcriptional regulator, redox-sensing transcriptional regulator